ncbi:chemotaxis protein CheB [Methanospirillum sp. J.3.6.1-F.2.7.3]|jgi:two-component system chemotaxis response regulator CheB|uniref:protein-glutamate methylesterase n=2 Tax=Methanospirillum TaxID=2202 RepID=A0A8E7AZH3_9EURY|nr:MULTISPECIES: CheB methylesterase domain-containing protein [Methanospirillum]MDX8550983.1 CheB methylesterase domain-containing protein [Methanospirillum hungatei]NLW76246.1 chemotaxis protein CheB [Methanomicrobiales archaeon]QVV87561.1 chemotaxis protein CheB [Methanospirillum sp. J.3.6.1-F.2.7.3]QXO95027.1 chemotaxis protein CheB [Methanospirillum hungatei]
MKIIIIGSSTGGPYIIESILSEFPVLPLTIIIVQHLPPTFTKTFKNHITSFTKMEVIIADKETRIKEQQIIIAPAGHHLIVKNNRYFQLDDGEKLHGVRPAVDLTMMSMQKLNNDKIMGIILTGMGRDGAEGLIHLHQCGGITIVQDPATAPIKSMPQASIKTGIVDFVLTPEQIREKIIAFGNDN